MRNGDKSAPYVGGKDKGFKAGEALRCCRDYLFIDRRAEEHSDAAEYKFNTYK